MATVKGRRDTIHYRDQVRIITHLFFVDDLKLNAKNEEKLRILLDLVTRFTQDFGMKVGESKCAYNITIRAKRKHQGEDLKVRSLTVKELPEGDSYKYLGLDESIEFDGPLNKEIVKTKCKRRVRKIWSSELKNINKVNTHNTFTVPIVTPTIGILPWKKKKIKDLDILTRRQLTINGSYHPASDMHRLYSRREEGKILRRFI